ncbi:MAG: hypothetical protein R3Y28_08705, partial [Candidatus Gastranaerophilales bacterium]
CYEQGKRLPTRQELADMHNYIFNTDIITATGDFYDLTLDDDKMADLNLVTVNSSTMFGYWSSEKINDTMSQGRHFTSTTSYDFQIKTNRSLSHVLARCVE